MNLHHHDSSRLLAHIHQTGLMQLVPAGAGSPGPPTLEEPGLRLDENEVLTATGHQTMVRTRHLSDLLGIGGDQPAPLADREAALALLQEEGQDPVLYRALRDIFPARTDTCTPVRADLVVFENGTLPGGEPYRSLGHWNPPGQVEAFEVLSGRIIMLIAGISPSGVPFCYAKPLSAGDQLAVPLGVWHVSYALEGPAVVFNMYANPLRPLDLGLHGGHDGKYRGNAPVAVTLRQSPDGRLSATGPAGALAAWGDPLRPIPAGSQSTAGHEPDWLAPEESLTGLFLRASADRWDQVIGGATADQAAPKEAAGVPGAW